MKKYLFLLLPFIAVAMAACDDDDDVMDTRLIKGQWELVSEDTANIFIYDFKTKGEHTWSWGTLTTYCLTYGGDPIQNEVYDWHVTDPANSDPVYLDLTLLRELPTDDPWEDTDRYIVERLTATEMVLRRDEVGDTQTRIRFIRRNGLTLP